MTQTDPQQPAQTGQGKAFFDRADEVAETGNWDFAIELYLEGIARETGNFKRGHKPLREVGLKRKAMGGKGPGLMEQIKRRAGKDPVTNLVNAEYLLAKEPGSVSYMEHVLKAARALNLGELVKWICDILMEAQRQTHKPSKRILELLTDSYRDIEEYASGIHACEMALKVAPGDLNLQEAMRELSAKYTIKKGKYDQDGDFARSVRDMEKQKDLAQRDAMVQSHDYLQQRLKETRAEYGASPTVPGKVNALVDALLKLEEPDYQNQAIEILTKAHKDTGLYPFKQRIGDIRMTQMTNKYRELVAAGNKQAAAEQARKQLAFELQEYTDRAENYPTDLTVQYELGRRQFLSGKFDDAIASLQHAQRDPRRRLRAMNYLGQSFAKKGWLQEASETFERALEGDVSEVRTKELKYNLGDVLEQMGELAKAQDQFSDVAQMDYTYRDVRQRMDRIRQQVRQTPGAGGEGES
ncbi:MAG: hypothetical protein KAX78_02675 [Phycisphaerae bacterium]|nr:hypothetical protein [Phycisphaerae bacterium]